MGDYLVDRLRRYAQDRPERDAVSFVQVSGSSRTTLTLGFAELDRRARSVAARLRSRCAEGDRVLLLYPTGLDFVEALIGCMYAGLVAVPAPLPVNNGRRGPRTAAILRNAGPAVVLTDSRSLADVVEAVAEAGAPELACVAGDTFGPDEDAAGPQPWIGADTPAFLQYTSGSTSDPKGVVVTHRSLADNIRYMERTFGLDESITSCSWLPLYHDMGLVGMLLAPLFLGTGTVLLSPGDFLRRPYLWLQLIDEHRVTNTAAPNFAYELCARQVTAEKAAALDLSSLRTAVNGAEPVNPGTLARFNERFAVSGLRPDAVAPCFGMAEATLLITATPRGRRAPVIEADRAALEQHVLVRAGSGAGAADGTNGANGANGTDSADRTNGPAEADRLPLVSSGRADWMDVRIVHPESRVTLPEGAVGEIWVRGESVSPGYWNNPEESARAFRAVTAEGEAGFLRTGDLGAFEDGELYVTGRIKDMLIIRGRNLYPHDIEREVAAMHPAFRGLSGSVCSVPTDQEDLVVMQELRVPRGEEVDPGELARRIQEELAGSLGVRLPSVVLLRPGHVHRTTSGKVQRSLMRELFLSGGLKPVHEELSRPVGRRYRAAAGAGGAA
ncbi:fatty acyl-AMP ligase [Kitasatospora sp. NPDC015120]|uniref:fatty acyl-AMP ligase n=1 Tax=Kitasatospora sp. NPDC015120 TaxID=3364023 RepID=UPI0036F48B3A